MGFVKHHIDLCLDPRLPFTSRVTFSKLLKFALFPPFLYLHNQLSLNLIAIRSKHKFSHIVSVQKFKLIHKAAPGLSHVETCEAEGCTSVTLSSISRGGCSSPFWAPLGLLDVSVQHGGQLAPTRKTQETTKRKSGAF